MGEKELDMEIARQNRENAEKVKSMIAAKIRRMRGEEVDEPVNVDKRLTLEEAYAQGNVIEAIKIKTGYYDKIDQEKELNELLADIDIVAVKAELKELEGKIAEHKNTIDRVIKTTTEQIEAEYEQEIRKHRANGGMRNGWQEISIQDEYQNRLDNIESMDTVRNLKSELAQMQNRKANLAYAENKFIMDNASLIEEEKKRKKLEQIRLAGLV